MEGLNSIGFRGKGAKLAFAAPAATWHTTAKDAQHSKVAMREPPVLPIFTAQGLYSIGSATKKTKVSKHFGWHVQIRNGTEQAVGRQDGMHMSGIGMSTYWDVRSS